VLKAIQDQQSGAQPAYTMEELRDANQKAQLFMQAQEMEMQRRQQEQQQEALQSSETNLKLGKEFLEKNAGKEGVMTTLSGLQYQVLKAAEGPKPAATDTVRVHYTGRLLNGTVFDSSVERGEPVEFPLNGVIPGWTEGLQLMSVGSKFRLWIPASLAYGARGRSGIGPNQVLEFEVELLEIK
jgi:FKBP-type peptidyl-prolyl cis-trans isomerase